MDLSKIRIKNNKSQNERFVKTRSCQKLEIEKISKIEMDLRRKSQSKMDIYHDLEITYKKLRDSDFKQKSVVRNDASYNINVGAGVVDNIDEQNIYHNLGIMNSKLGDLNCINDLAMNNDKNYYSNGNPKITNNNGEHNNSLQHPATDRPFDHFKKSTNELKIKNEKHAKKSESYFKNNLSKMSIIDCELRKKNQIIQLNDPSKLDFISKIMNNSKLQNTIHANLKLQKRAKKNEESKNETQTKLNNCQKYNFVKKLIGQSALKNHSKMELEINKLCTKNTTVIENETHKKPKFELKSPILSNFSFLQKCYKKSSEAVFRRRKNSQSAKQLSSNLQVFNFKNTAGSRQINQTQTVITEENSDSEKPMKPHKMEKKLIINQKVALQKNDQIEKSKTNKQLRKFERPKSVKNHSIKVNFMQKVNKKLAENCQKQKLIKIIQNYKKMELKICPAITNNHNSFKMEEKLQTKKRMKSVEVSFHNVGEVHFEKSLLSFGVSSHEKFLNFYQKATAKIRDFTGEEIPMKSMFYFYFIEKLIDKGAYGKVFLAKSVFTKRKVAIKCFEIEKNDAYKSKLQATQEVEIMNGQKHKNIIQLLDFYSTKNLFFLVMELAPNGNLLNYIQKHGLFDELEFIPILKQITSGLCYLHKRNILHRDIKLGNLLVTEDNILKISDF